jgi:hypothetical protein
MGFEAKKQKKNDAKNLIDFAGIIIYKIINILFVMFGGWDAIDASRRICHQVYGISGLQRERNFGGQAGDC